MTSKMASTTSDNNLNKSNEVPQTEESYLNVQSKFGETAFMLACQKGHKDVVKLFLDSENYIQLNARDFFGDNAFIIFIGKIAGVWSDLSETISANERMDIRR